MVSCSDALVDPVLSKVHFDGIGNWLGAAIRDKEFRGPKISHSFLTNEPENEIFSMLCYYLGYHLSCEKITVLIIYFLIFTLLLCFGILPTTSIAYAIKG